jgi:shikimate 5-dehydrogenase
MGLRLVDRLELAAQEAACNFQFWTGVSPNFELIRESIEEYQAY